MSSVRSGVFISLASSNAGMAISFVASMLLARILTPHEIGIYSVAFVFAGLLRTIREMGLGAYIIQERDLTPERIRTAFGISILIAVVTGGLIAVLAGIAGDFYREPGVTHSLYIVALSFVLVPLGSTTMAILRREMHFKDMAVIETISVLTQSCAAVLLAWLGFSYMSLAWSALLGTAVTVVCTFFYRPISIPWMPSLREWRRVIGFSAFASGSSLVNYASFSASDLVLGRMLNMESVALFNRANGLSELLSGVISRVMNTVGLPYFSKQQRDGVPQAPAFIEATTIICMFTTPIYAVLAILATPTILLVFGTQWTDSIAVLQILCVGAVLRGPGFLISQVMTAAGGVRQQLSLDIQALVIKFGAVIGCASFGLEAVAWGYGAAGLITTAIKMHALHRLINLSWTALWPIVQQGALTTVLSAVGPVMVMLLMPQLPAYLILLLGGATAVLGWTCAVLISANPLRPTLLGAVASLRNRA